MYRTITPAVALSMAILLTGADWPQFRGTHGGVATRPVPTEFDASDRNVAWKIELPGEGISSPVVADGRIYLTASDGRKESGLHVLAFDAHSGKRLWQHTLQATGPAKCHQKTTLAAPSPAVSDDHVVAHFGTNDCVCLTTDGELVWHRSLFKENPGAAIPHGLASSPLIVEGVVVLHVENETNPFACGIDLKTGKDVWKIERPSTRNWSSPVPLGDGLVLLQGKERLSAIDVKTGKEVWGLDHRGAEKESPTVSGGVLFVPGEGGITAFRLLGRSAPREQWRSNRLGPQTASPVVVGDRVFSVRGASLVKGDTATGEELAKTRLDGRVTASLIAAGGIVYCFNEDGTAFVIRPAEGEDEDVILAECQLGESVVATPSAADGALYVRGAKHLWKFAEE